MRRLPRSGVPVLPGEMKWFCYDDSWYPEYFAKKFAAAKSREEKRKLSEEQRLYWWKIYNDHPFAVSIPGLFRSQYLSFWRHAGWKAPELK